MSDLFGDIGGFFGGLGTWAGQAVNTVLAVPGDIGNWAYQSGVSFGAANPEVIQGTANLAGGLGNTVGNIVNGLLSGTAVTVNRLLAVPGDLSNIPGNVASGAKEELNQTLLIAGAALVGIMLISRK